MVSEAERYWLLQEAIVMAVGHLAVGLDVQAAVAPEKQNK